jgi:hypothetical protein
MTNNTPPLTPPKHSLVDDLVYLIHHLQSTLFMIISFIFITNLIQTQGLDSIKDLVMFLLGGVVGIINSAAENSKGTKS